MPVLAHADATDTLPARKIDFRPLLLLLVMLAAGRWMAGDTIIWTTLTIAGIGMGFILFMAASGLSLVFGLMGVMNFAHGMLMTFGAVAGVFLLRSEHLPWLRLWFYLDHPTYNVLAIVALTLCSIGLSVAVGWILERLLIRPARMDMLRQIMLTAAGAMILGQMFTMAIGNGVGFAAPPNLSGSVLVGPVPIEKMRLLLIVIGLAVWGGLSWLLLRTRFGLLVRAATANRDMVEAMGYRAERIFMTMFLLSVALAALGGLLLGIQQAQVPVSMGSRMLPQIFFVMLIAGLGSVNGTLLAAILLSLLTNYIGYAFPMLNSFSGIALMMAVVLWRPEGLYPLNNR